MRTNQATVAIIVSGLLTSGCANEYDRQNIGYFAPVGQPLTEAAIEYQVKTLNPLCDDFVIETTPGRWKTIGAHAWNSAWAGALASTLGLITDKAVVGKVLRLVPHAVPASLATNAAIYGVIGGAGGNDAYNVRIFAGKQACIVRAIGGIMSYGQKVADAVGKDGKPLPKNLQGILTKNLDGSISAPPPPWKVDGVAPAAKSPGT